MAINPDELDKLMEKAGLGARSSKKMRDANKSPEKTEGEDGERKRGLGHGSAELVLPVAGEL